MQDRAATIKTAQECLSRGMWQALHLWSSIRAGQVEEFKAQLDDEFAEVAADLTATSRFLDDLMEGELTGEGPTLEQIGKGGAAGDVDSGAED